jgi:hypothetical protein
MRNPKKKQKTKFLKARDLTNAYLQNPASKGLIVKIRIPKELLDFVSFTVRRFPRSELSLRKFQSPYI